MPTQKVVVGIQTLPLKQLLLGVDPRSLNEIAKDVYRGPESYRQRSLHQGTGHIFHPDKVFQASGDTSPWQQGPATQNTGS